MCPLYVQVYKRIIRLPLRQWQRRGVVLFVVRLFFIAVTDVFKLSNYYPKVLKKVHLSDRLYPAPYAASFPHPCCVQYIYIFIRLACESFFITGSSSYRRHRSMMPGTFFSPPLLSTRYRTLQSQNNYKFTLHGKIDPVRKYQNAVITTEITRFTFSALPSFWVQSTRFNSGVIHLIDRIRLNVNTRRGTRSICSCAF